jgi:adenylosuccinate lyase
MPNKVNPIDFENGEGRMVVANSLFGGFHELLVSRLQRHLSDSTIQREIGSAYASCLIGYKSTFKGLKKISVNEAAIRADLADTPEVVSEAIQTILRREGHTDAYEVIKAATQGKALDAEGFAAMIDDLEVSDEVKAELRAITPENYIGNAAEWPYDKRS